MAMLEVKNLSKGYGRPEGPVRALQDASLTVEAGQFVVVQGPSGAGKTTLLLAAGGLLTPDSGCVVVDGQDPYRLSAEGRARFRASSVGFVFQEFHLVPYLSVMENVLAPSLAFASPGAEHRARELLDHFGLTGRTGHVPAELSTGERQRTALARALLNQPKLLLADEPTGNLDGKNAEIVLRHLADFADAGGAVLMVTHGADADSLAHRTVHLEHGKIC